MKSPSEKKAAAARHNTGKKKTSQRIEEKSQEQDGRHSNRSIYHNTNRTAKKYDKRTGLLPPTYTESQAKFTMLPNIFHRPPYFGTL